MARTARRRGTPVLLSEVLRVHGKVLLLQSLLWDDEVREASFPSLDADVRIQKREIDMATSLVQSFESDFRPADYTDEYQEQLKRLVDAKLEQGESVDTAATFGEQPEPDDDTGAEPIDLMEVLQRSIERQRGTTGAKTASGAKRSGTAKPAATSRSAKTGTAKTGTAKTSGAKTGTAKTAPSKASTATKRKKSA